MASQNLQPDHETDLLVIGGGVNGVGIALDAAGRGLQVMLCEKGDLAGATSSASSKLIHGGLRYLEHYEFRLVKEALSEREVLLNKAPHIMWPLRFRLPHQKHLRPAWMLRAGLFLYDSLAKRNVLPGSKKLKMQNDSPLVSQISTCFEYSDGWVDDARLVVLNAMAARDKGADIRVRTECVSASKQANHWMVTLRGPEGKTFTVKTRGLVNATGPWAISFLDRMENTDNPDTMRMVKGSHLVVPRLYAGSEAYILQNEDGRIVFLIPYENDFSLVGTTDENYTGDPQAASISGAETDYLLKVVKSYFKTQIGEQDIVHSYSGVRPLLEEKNASAQELTRDYKVEVRKEQNSPLLMNIFGGKITTYRKLAEQAVDKLTDYYKLTQGPWTAKAPLPGGDFSDPRTYAKQLQRRFPWLPESLARRYTRQYGTLCEEFLQDKTALADMGEDFGSQLFAAEVDYLVVREWAVCADDILWRRTKQGLHFSTEHVTRLNTYLHVHPLLHHYTGGNHVSAVNAEENGVAAAGQTV